MLIDPETGIKLEFPEIVAALLVAEHSRSKEEAEALVKRFPNVIVNGIMAGLTIGNARIAAIALEMAESRELKEEKA